MGRIYRIATALLVALVLAAVIQGLLDHEASGLVRRGDFPAFYAAGKIVLRGETARLYDPALQEQIENEYWPSLGGRYLAFAYPPLVALCMTPFSLFSPLLGKLVFTIVSLAILALASYFAVCGVSRYEGHWFLAFVACLWFPPVLNGIAGGQNVTFSMFLYAGMMHCLSRGTRRGEWLSGLFAGLWWFKPHYAFLVMLFLLAMGRSRPAGIAAVFSFIFWAINLCIAGPGWLTAWHHAVESFAALDLRANQHQMVSLAGLGHVLLGGTSMKLEGVSFALLVVLLLCLGTYVRRDVERSRAELQKNALLLLGPTVVFFSPHALFYDLGVCHISLIRLGNLTRWREAALLTLLYVCSFIVMLIKQDLLMEPMFVYILLTFALVCCEIRKA